MPKTFDVNATELIRYTKKLENIHRSKLPNAVRNTLNRMAFDTKKNRILPEAERNFNVRKPNFYKVFSSVQKAEGWDVNKMISKVGIIDKNGRNAALNQKQQQIGGAISGRTFIPFLEAREGNNIKGPVASKNRLKKINRIFDTKNNSSRGRKNRMISTIAWTMEQNKRAYIKHTSKSGNDYVFRVDKGGNDLNLRRGGVTITPLYSVDKGRKVKVQGHPFVKRGAAFEARNVEKLFIKQAKFQINRK